MRLHVADFAGRNIRVAARLADEHFLRVPAGDGDAIGAAVLIGRGAADESVNFVAIGLRGGKRFQNDCTDAFSADESIRARVESLATSVRRKHGHAAERNVIVLFENRVDAGDNGHCAIAAPEALAGDVAGGQRGGTGGVHRHARPAQIKAVGNAVGSDAEGRAGGGINIRFVAPAAGVLQHGIIRS